MLAGTLWVVAGTLWVVAGCGAGAIGAVPRPFAVAAADRTATGGAGVDPVGLFAISPQRKLYLECHGTGAPTVVLVPGLIAAADTWSYVTTPSATLRRSPAAVYPSVGRITRVCSYDRPGTASEDGALSPSTPVPQPTTPLGDTSDLHRLLAVAGVACPCVLVGWSFGGLIARAYASTYPRSVDGLVLVDSTSEYLQTSMSPADFDVFEALVRDDDAKRIAQWSDVERFDPATTFAQIRALPPVRPMPVVVLSSDKFDPAAFATRLPPGAPADYPRIFWRAQLESQDRLAALFPGAVHISDTRSEHNIQNNQPRLVFDWIRSVVARAR